ncbi:hypothetical protein ASE99_22590 [Serratia sp. Leaf51]|nr:hypothetical protein ASE99_22590 [Serratia sp. Leaf51]
MKAVKALYRPSFLVLVLLFVSLLCGWVQLIHIGFMPPQWMAWRIFAMIVCLFLGLAWFIPIDCSENLIVANILIVVPWVLYGVVFGLGSIALWHPWIALVNPDAFYYLGGASYFLAAIPLIFESSIFTRYWE